MKLVSLQPEMPPGHLRLEWRSSWNPQLGTDLMIDPEPGLYIPSGLRKPWNPPEGAG